MMDDERREWNMDRFWSGIYKIRIRGGPGRRGGGVVGWGGGKGCVNGRENQEIGGRRWLCLSHPPLVHRYVVTRVVLSQVLVLTGINHVLACQLCFGVHYLLEE